jgi:hypothetical protein
MSEVSEQTECRWRILSEAPPARRSEGDPCDRRRYRVKCVCGELGTIFAQDLQRGLASGCRDPRCKHAHELSQRIKASMQGQSMAEALKCVTEWVSESRDIRLGWLPGGEDDG